MFNIKKGIYLDFVSFTPISKFARKVFIKTLKKSNLGNAGSLHKWGQNSNNILKESRERCARILNVKSNNIFFSSGATESNERLVSGVLFGNVLKGIELKNQHVIVSEIEHKSVTEQVEMYSKMGLKVSKLKVNENGLVSPGDLEDLLTKETVLVSVIFVNNEIGSIQPLRKISKIIRDFEKKNDTNIVLFSDAAQGKYQSLIIDGLGVDAISIDSIKVYGPTGVGMLYVKNDINIFGKVVGRDNYYDIRPGTPNISGIFSFTNAFEQISLNRKTEFEKMFLLRKYLVEKLFKEFDGVSINGGKNKMEHLSPHIVNINFPNVDHQYLATLLSERDVFVSTRSTCCSMDGEESNILSAIGVGGGIRVSFGKDSRKKDIDVFIKTTRKVIELAQKSLLQYK